MLPSVRARNTDLGPVMWPEAPAHGEEAPFRPAKETTGLKEAREPSKAPAPGPLVPQAAPGQVAPGQVAPGLADALLDRLRARDADGDGWIEPPEVKAAPVGDAAEVGRALARKAVDDGHDAILLGERHIRNVGRPNTEPTGLVGLEAVAALREAGKTPIWAEEVPWENKPGEMKPALDAFNEGRIDADALEAQMRAQFAKSHPDREPQAFDWMYGNMLEAARLGAKVLNLDTEHDENVGDGENRDAAMDVAAREILGRYDNAVLVGLTGAFHNGKLPDTNSSAIGEYGEDDGNPFGRRLAQDRNVFSAFVLGPRQVITSHEGDRAQAGNYDAVLRVK